MLKKIGNDVTTLKEGLDPENLAYWYQKIIHETREMAPPWLTDKINVKQDPILHMKFNIDISKRAVRYLILPIAENLADPPETIPPLLLIVHQPLSSEMDKS